MIDEVEVLPLEDRRIQIENVVRTSSGTTPRTLITARIAKFTCSKCGNLYRTSRSCRRHEQECGTLPGFQCMICLQRFMRKDHLTKHSQNLHKTDINNMANMLNFVPEDNHNFHSNN